jgi:transposase InsO family protein
MHAVLHRHGLVKGMGRPGTVRKAHRYRPASRPTICGAPTSRAEFKLGNGQYCPLTVTDHASRYLFLCEALDSVREDNAITAFQQLLHERGLPNAIHSDNAVPFASPNALFNLSKLTVWWLRLGIAIERIRPGRAGRAATEVHALAGAPSAKPRWIMPTSAPSRTWRQIKLVIRESIAPQCSRRLR